MSYLNKEGIQSRDLCERLAGLSVLVGRWETGGLFCQTFLLPPTVAYQPLYVTVCITDIWPQQHRLESHVGQNMACMRSRDKTAPKCSWLSITESCCS